MSTIVYLVRQSKEAEDDALDRVDEVLERDLELVAPVHVLVASAAAELAERVLDLVDDGQAGAVGTTVGSDLVRELVAPLAGLSDARVSLVLVAVALCDGSAKRCCQDALMLVWWRAMTFLSVPSLPIRATMSISAARGSRSRRWGRAPVEGTAVSILCLRMGRESLTTCLTLRAASVLLVASPAVEAKAAEAEARTAAM